MDEHLVYIDLVPSHRIHAVSMPHLNHYDATDVKVYKMQSSAVYYNERTQTSQMTATFAFSSMSLPVLCHIENIHTSTS